jgi:heavy metal sensor kinase
MRLTPKSVRARLTLWYTLVLTVPLAAFAVVSYVVFSRALYSRTDAFISDALTVFGREVVAERRAVPELNAAIYATLAEVRFQEVDIVVHDESGRLIAMSGRDPAPALDWRARDSATIVEAVRATATGGVGRSVSAASGPYRVMTRAQTVDDRALAIGAVYPLHEVDAILGRIRRMFWIAIPLLILSAATGGWFLAKRSFVPVTAMASRAAEIGATTLHERLPVVADDELGTLARVLNELLDRLEGAFEQQRRFMADASHELRTPTAVLRAEADITLSRPSRPESEYRESMSVVQDAARRLTRIVDDIFLLARADAGHLVMHPRTVDLHDVVVDSVRAVQSVASGRDVAVDLGEVVEARVHGDADLLGRVLLNLLDNAVKHAPAASRVDVRMSRADGVIEVSIVDTGPGIPREAQRRVFERFYRVDTARSRAENTTTSGAGLGLPIARRIAEMHRGSVELVSSAPGRTEFRLRVPALAGGGT